jgi:RNA polymerase sigma-70 factor, ECF subfamily
MNVDSGFNEWYGSTCHASGEGFDEIVIPHLEAGRRLARWLVRNPDDADDVVQEASLRAFRYFGTFEGGNGRAWFLRIVRNTCATWHRRAPHAPTDEFDEEYHSDVQLLSNPERLLLQIDDATRVDRAMRHLSDRARELLRLRELEGLSYREVAKALDIPMGTVMSGLARAREAFREALVNEQHSSGTI